MVWAQQDTALNGVFLAAIEIEALGRSGVRSRTTMGDSKESRERKPTEEIIAAFDRERAESQELNRRHTEKVRAAHADDRQSFIERRRRPR